MGFCKGIGHYIRGNCRKKGKKKLMRKKELGENKLNKKFIGEFVRETYSVYSLLRNEGKNLVKITKNLTSFLIKTAGKGEKIMSLEICKGEKNLLPYINIVYTEEMSKQKPKEEVISLKDFSKKEIYLKANAFFS